MICYKNFIHIELDSIILSKCLLLLFFRIRIITFKTFSFPYFYGEFFYRLLYFLLKITFYDTLFEIYFCVINIRNDRQQLLLFTDGHIMQPISIVYLIKSFNQLADSNMHSTFRIYSVIHCLLAAFGTHCSSDRQHRGAGAGGSNEECMCIHAAAAAAY